MARELCTQACELNITLNLNKHEFASAKLQVANYESERNAKDRYFEKLNCKLCNKY